MISYSLHGSRDGDNLLNSTAKSLNIVIPVKNLEKKKR